MAFQQLMNYVFDNYSDLDDHPCQRQPDCKDCKESCVDCHRKRYQEWNKGRPRYVCENIKRVYLQRNLAAHVAQTKSVISKTVLGDLADLEKVNAASFGGGPGVECIALADLLNAKSCSKLRFRSFDIEASWQDYFNGLTSKLGEVLENLSLNSKFICQDFLRRSTGAHYDVVFVPWVLSEVGASDIPTFAQNAINACKNGGHVVVLERTESNLGQVIIDAFQDIDGVSRFFSDEDNVKGWCGIFFDDDHRERFKSRLNYESAYYVFQRD